jgi:hypothetical protein
MSSEPVTVMTFAKEEDAELKQMLLEQEGIESFLNNANVATLNLGSALGEIKLQVAEADAARALAILNNAPASEPASPRCDNQCLDCGAMMPENQSVCPKCGWTYNKQ